jgi:L-threonylcarbamoyladenylate synthase
LKHYQLNCKSILVFGKNEEKKEAKIKEIANSYTFPILLTFSENVNAYAKMNVIDIGSKNSLEEISKNIFTKLRQAEKLNPDIIIIEGVEKTGLGLAIMNRLLNVCNNNYIEIIG